MNDAQQKKAAKDFSAYWKEKGYEKGESQAFWLSLLRDVYDVEHPERFISFEDQVQLDHTSFIDGYIESTHVMIEQKGLNKDLRKGIRQSDGKVLSSYEQAVRYSSMLPYSKRPRWIITCNFAEFLIYDMENPTGEPEVLLLENLPKEYHKLDFLIDTRSTGYEKEIQISKDAGKITAKLYNALIQQYQNPDSPESLKSLNMLCVRLVFCFYADKSGIFKHNQFKHYLRDVSVNKWHRELKDLFRVFDTPSENRDYYDDEKLNAFPYVNGGLFADENIEIPRFTQEIADIILNEACAFNWQDISPTIFGAIFESTLNPDTRRSGGMHYTSIENIHKVIDPLFLDDLRKEFESIKEVKQRKDGKTRKELLDSFQQKLSSLTFLDPACGSGNFLTETFISLRKLENEVLVAGIHGEQMLIGNTGDANPIQVSIGQFYGIEINDFAVTVAKTALWIAEHQMMQETEQIMQNVQLEYLPLTSYANIVEGNSLRIDWETVVPKEKLSYIIGNPPFVGHQLRNENQVNDMAFAFSDLEKHGKLDYVCAWYNIACNFIAGTKIEVAFVSTNSITQGESVGILWKFLIEKKKLEIQFAHHSFIWDSEANEKAHVHCVIIGFTCYQKSEEKTLFSNGKIEKVKHINGYLINADDIYIQARGKCLTKGLAELTKGSQPTDGGYFFLNENEKEELEKKYPVCKQFIKLFVGATEFINNKKRYCLWLKDVSPSLYRNVPPVMERLKNISECRLKSPTKAVKIAASTPALFTQIRQPDTNYLIIPRHSSENRKYIPFGFMPSDVIVGDACSIIPDATIYMFGVLESNVHMSWMKIICGRIKSDYRYSPAVYNNFPWCTPTAKQKQKIEQTAQTIIDVRAKYPNCSLADLYDDVTMPPDLRKAHQENDTAVMLAYGFKKKMSEPEIVAELMKMYQKLAEDSQ